MKASCLNISVIFVIAMCQVHIVVLGQASFSFHHLTASQGLNDNYIGEMCEDKDGYMWFATLGGLNRFDGSRVERFTHIAGDTTSPLISNPFTIVCDKNGRLWIGYADGFIEYKYETRSFRRVPALMDKGVFTLVAGSDNKLYMRTYGGLYCYNPSEEKLETLGNPLDSAMHVILNRTRTSTLFGSGDHLYIGFHKRIVDYNTKTKQAQIIDIPGLTGSVSVIEMDSKGRLWIANNSDFELRCINPDGTQLLVLDSLLYNPQHDQSAAAADLFIDEQDRLWIATNQSGLILYDIPSQVATRYRFQDHPGTSISSNLLRNIFRDSRGIFWLGGVQGVDYFDPNSNLFEIIYPFEDKQAVQYARVASEDRKGNFWFSTSDGIVRYTPSDRSYAYWRNSTKHPRRIYHNSSRGNAEDQKGRIWCVTAAGVNRIDPVTGNVEFLTLKDGIPQSFFGGAFKDGHDNIWFGTNVLDGLYYYSPVEDTILSIATHPDLKRFAGVGGRYIFEDSKQRLWLGFNGSGLAVYDRNTREIKHWHNDGTQDTTIIGNLILDIKEDKNGVVWMSCLNGITGIDLERNILTSFNDKNGLGSNVAGPIAVDERNRLWVGVSNSLVMIDSSRTRFTYFNEDDGIPSPAFSDHHALYCRDGDIMMPTAHGYVKFNPLKYRETALELKSYLTSFTVFDREHSMREENGTTHIRLRPKENFFTFTLGALNFRKASQTWYAYQLVGFDQDWRYTQDPKAVYTNVPGGTYTFKFKASADAQNWSTADNEISIRIGRIFYATFWFWTLIGLAIATLLYWIYWNRINAQRALLQLQGKAQLLEKEKAVVQYESLKQQLNPHFLFNSLTSLSSLIQIDTNVAADFLDSLSKTYRYILKSSENETVPLSEEIKFAQTYVKLQRTRFEEGLIVEFQVDEKYLHRRIVPVTIQNLIENAIKHNIIDVDTPLIIRVFTENNVLVISNNLQRKSFVETSNKQGLANLKALYHYLSDDQIEVTDDSNCFTIRIPLL